MSLKTYMATSLCLALTLSACTTHKTVDMSSTTPPPPTLTAAQVRAMFAGKTWNWTSPSNNSSGTTIYAANGTLMAEVKGKGMAKGTWHAIDGNLCETILPSPGIAPNGFPEACRPIIGNGPTYQLGKSTFTPA